MVYQSILWASWGAVMIVWFITGLKSKTTLRMQSRVSRFVTVAAGVIAFWLLFDPGTGVGVLGFRVVPVSPAWLWTGSILSMAGAAFSIWARLYLGENWSAAVTLKQDHSLVRSGPYACVRHPIYSGFLLAMLGAALVGGQLRCFAGLLIAFVAWYLKSRTEESFMLEQFQGEYVEYRKRVRALVPFVL